MVTVHRLADRRFTPWKNGDGETAEIVCEPPGAGLDDFAWRISTARVAKSGPFSHFPGVSRTLMILEGGPMTLRFADGTALTSGPEAIQFAGDLGCEATLDGPPLLDLNMMCRAPFSCAVARRWSPASARLAARYLLALTDLPALGLYRLDLAETDSPFSAEAALQIDILRG